MCPKTRLLPISIHTLRVEGDRGYDNGVVISYDFYPHPPGGGRLVAKAGRISMPKRFLSTPSGWRAT